MDRRYELVKKYIDEMDYYCLLSQGAPSDEFDTESKEISSKIANVQTEIGIAQIIADVFNRSFLNNDTPDLFMACARKIYRDLDH